MANRLTHPLMISHHLFCVQSTSISWLHCPSSILYYMAIKPFLWLRTTSLMLEWLWCNTSWLISDPVIRLVFTSNQPPLSSSFQIKLLQGFLHWTPGRRKERFLLTPSICLILIQRIIFHCIQFLMIGAGTSPRMLLRKSLLWS